MEEKIKQGLENDLKILNFEPIKSLRKYQSPNIWEYTKMEVLKTKISFFKNILIYILFLKPLDAVDFFSEKSKSI